MITTGRIRCEHTENSQGKELSARRLVLQGNVFVGDGEMALAVKRRPCKHEPLSSDPQPGAVLHTGSTRSGEAETDRFLELTGQPV